MGNEERRKERERAWAEVRRKEGQMRAFLGQPPTQALEVLHLQRYVLCIYIVQGGTRYLKLRSLALTWERTVHGI